MFYLSPGFTIIIISQTLGKCSSPNFQQRCVIHKEQPAMYFPVANLFFTSDMR